MTTSTGFISTWRVSKAALPRCALEVIKPERMVFATDYPQNFNNSDPTQGKSIDGVHEYIDDIRALPLDQKAKDGMLGETAARLLKLGA